MKVERRRVHWFAATHAPNHGDGGAMNESSSLGEEHLVPEVLEVHVWVLLLHLDGDLVVLEVGALQLTDAHDELPHALVRTTQPCSTPQQAMYSDTAALQGCHGVLVAFYQNSHLNALGSLSKGFSPTLIFYVLQVEALILDEVCRENEAKHTHWRKSLTWLL